MINIEEDHDLGDCQLYLYDLLKYRRTNRSFQSIEIDDQKLHRILQTGILAPSGSNKCPYKIIVVKNHNLKEQIRQAAEEVEREFYKKKKKDKSDSFYQWSKNKGIRAVKPFLTQAPILLCIAEDSRFSDKHSKESTWVMIAYLLIAIANEGLSTVTYTPEPQEFIRDLLNLPDYYKPQVILPIGYPKETRKKTPVRPTISQRVEYR